MKTVGYVRVSSKKQVKFGKSIDNQITRIKEYCNYENLNLVEIVKDLGISGKSLNREGIQYIINLVNTNQVEVVIVNDLSRLGRNLKQVLEVISLFRYKGVQLHVIKEGIRGNDNMSNLLLNIMGSINEFEVIQLGERIQEVKLDRKSKGKSYTNPQYGFKHIDGEIVVDKHEMSNRRRIVRLRSKGYSWLDIEKDFERRGILSRIGKKFYGSTMRNMFESEMVKTYKKTG